MAESRGALRVALVQAPADGGLNSALALVAHTARVAPDIVVLPENWLSPRPVHLEDYMEAAEKVAEESGAGLVVAGAQYVVDSDGARRSVGLAAAPGRGVFRVCEKVFPSRAVGERSFLARGRFLGVFEYRGWRFSCVVCVDIFYPELVRAATVQGAAIIFNPAKITVDRVPLWRSVLLARAAENVVYSVGVNPHRGSYRDGRVVEGGSAVYGPDGKPVVEVGAASAPVVVELDYSRIEAARRRWAFRDDLQYEMADVYERFSRSVLRKG